MKNLKNLDTKEKMLIVKAVIDIATKIYKDNTDFILNQVLKTTDNQIANDFGMFYKSTTKAKTIQDVIDSKYKQIEKLQDEIATLGTYADKTAIYTDETNKLMSKHSMQADNIAIDLLQELLDNLDSKRLNKSVSKQANIK